MKTSYYGRLDIKLVRKHSNLGMFMIDETYKQLLQKNIDNITKMNELEKEFNGRLKKLTEKVNEIILIIDKLKIGLKK